MSRRILEIPSLDLIREVAFPEPVRLVFIAPGRGGPRVTDVRATLTSQGRLRLSGTALSTFADLDPGEPETPLIALDTIVRDDPAGLERMLLSALPHVDEIVIGVDGRSGPETLKVAQGYADCVYVFEADDVGLTAEEWAPSEKNPRGKIPFATARNLGRERVRAPWTLVIDSDEYLQTDEDLRHVVKINSEVSMVAIGGGKAVMGTFAPLVRIVQNGRVTFETRDHQRLALTRYRWHSNVHNQLHCDDAIPPPHIATVIVEDKNLRAEAEQALRDAQREFSIDDLTEDAKAGNLNALFHLAKHRVGSGPIEEAVRLVEDFRLRCEPNSVLGWKRQWIALGLAMRFYRQENDLGEANRWAVRALLDGPSIAAFCILGDIAEDECDLPRAKTWYEAACAVSDIHDLAWPTLAELRTGRLAGLRLALSSPENTKRALQMLKGDEEPGSPEDASSSTAPTSGT